MRLCVCEGALFGKFVRAILTTCCLCLYEEERCKYFANGSAAEKVNKPREIISAPYIENILIGIKFSLLLPVACAV